MWIENKDNLKSWPSLLNNNDALRSEINKDLSLLKEVIWEKWNSTMKKISENFHLLSTNELQSISNSLKLAWEKDKRISQDSRMNMAKFIWEKDNPDSALSNLDFV